MANVLILTAQKRQAFLDSLREMPNVTHAARSVGCTRAAVYEVYKTEPDFAKLWDAALKEGIEMLEFEANRRAFLGVNKPMSHQGHFTYVRDYTAIDPETGKKVEPWKAPLKLGPDGQPIVQTVKEYSDTLAIFLLKAHAPEKFRDTLDLTVKGELDARILNARKRTGG